MSIAAAEIAVANDRSILFISLGETIVRNGRRHRTRRRGRAWLSQVIVVESAHALWQGESEQRATPRHRDHLLSVRGVRNRVRRHRSAQINPPQFLSRVR